MLQKLSNMSDDAKLNLKIRFACSRENNCLQTSQILCYIMM